MCGTCPDARCASSGDLHERRGLSDRSTAGVESAYENALRRTVYSDRRLEAASCVAAERAERAGSPAAEHEPARDLRVAVPAGPEVRGAGAGAAGGERGASL